MNDKMTTATAPVLINSVISAIFFEAAAVKSSDVHGDSFETDKAVDDSSGGVPHMLFSLTDGGQQEKVLIIGIILLRLQQLMPLLLLLV